MLPSLTTWQNILFKQEESSRARTPYSDIVSITGFTNCTLRLRRLPVATAVVTGIVTTVGTNDANNRPRGRRPKAKAKGPYFDPFLLSGYGYIPP